MVTVDEAIIAKIVRNGKHFEILVDPELAYEFRDGKTVSIQKMLAINIVCTDAKKGDKASHTDIEAAFGTSDIEKIAEQIVRHGEIQLTTEFRRKKIEERKKQIATLISKNAVNPQTKMPHPADRIINAMEQSHFSVDPMKTAEQQMDDAIKAIKQLLPISFEEITLNIEIPAQYSGRAYGVIKELHPEKENWLSNGSLAAKVKIPAALLEVIYRKLGAITEGNVKIEEVKGDRQ